MLILLDQDGVLADFEKGFLYNWREEFPNEFYVPLDERINIKMSEDYPEELREQVASIYTTKGFIFNLPPIEGAIEGVNHLLALGHEVRICTSPLSEYKNCVEEKYAWVEQYFGREFTKQIILSKDKTLIRGDIIIDDKPNLEGIVVPEWEHIIFDQPYNRNVRGKRRISWDNYKEILETI